MSECHICGRSTTYGNDPTCECDEDMVSLKRRVAELEAERDRYREAIKNAASHHHQRQMFESGTEDAEYHEERRNVLLFHLNLM